MGWDVNSLGTLFDSVDLGWGPVPTGPKCLAGFLKWFWWKWFTSVQSLSHVWLFATPWNAACQASLSITKSRSLLKLMSIESVMPSNHLILRRPFTFCPQSLPASGPFPVSQLFAWGGQSTGISASILPMNTQDWSPLGWTGWISPQSKGLARVFSSSTVQKHQFFGAQLSSQSNSHIHTWPLEKPWKWLPHYNSWNTVDCFQTGVWTARVHLYVDFFQ